MSQSQEILADPELKEMILSGLKESGHLADLRARLRASVFLLLDGQKEFRIEQPIMNPYLAEADGEAAVGIVCNFLEKIGMHQTLSVFNVEAGLHIYPHSFASQNFASHKGAEALDLDGESPVPLLLQLMRKSTNATMRVEADRPKTAHRKESKAAYKVEDPQDEGGF